MHYYFQAFRKYADFAGRARRTEYWMFYLFNLIFSIVMIVIDGVVGTMASGSVLGVFTILYSLVTFLPSLAVAVRRLHDTNKSGWMLLVSFIPLIGSIWLLVLLATEGDRGNNDYGPDPKRLGGHSTYRDHSLLDTPMEAFETNATTEEQTNRDKIILMVVIWMFVARFFWFVIRIAQTDFFSTNWFKTVNTLISLVWAFIPLLLAFAVKDKSKRTIVFVLAGLYVLNGLYGVISEFF
ncbi:MAG: DUF805 domain-containing protein [Bacteroidota bacterium]